MSGGLLRVTLVRANEPGLSLCVTSDSGHSKIHVLREPGPSDGPWRQSVTLAAASDSGYFRKEKRNSHASHTSSVKSDPLPLATPGTLAVAWPCVKQRQHLLLQRLHPSRAGRRWFSGGPQVGEDSGRRGSWMPARSRSPGQVATPCPSGLQWLRLSLRSLRSDDTLLTFANGRVAQHTVDPLGTGVGVPRLLVGRANNHQEAARASGVPP